MYSRQLAAGNIKLNFEPSRGGVSSFCGLQKWGDYDAFGDAVAPTHFVPMKTPLGSEIIDNWDQDQPPRDPLTLDILVESQNRKARTLGMIIDLSNHETLYAADLKNHCIKYERVPVRTVPQIMPSHATAVPCSFPLLSWLQSLQILDKDPPYDSKPLSSPLDQTYMQAQVSPSPYVPYFFSTSPH